MHTKVTFILIGIGYFALLVLGGVTILPLLLIPSWALAIAILATASTRLGQAKPENCHF